MDKAETLDEALLSLTSHVIHKRTCWQINIKICKTVHYKTEE